MKNIIKNFISKKRKFITICILVIILIGILTFNILTGTKNNKIPKTIMEQNERIDISDEFKEEVTRDKQFADGNLTASQIQINKIGNDYSITMEIYNNTEVVYKVSSLELILLDENGEVIINMVCNVNDIDKFIRVSFDTTVDISKLSNVVIRKLS